jgi:lipoate-protein ligase A
MSFYRRTPPINFDPEDMAATLNVAVEKLAKRALTSVRQRSRPALQAETLSFGIN